MVSISRERLLSRSNLWIALLAIITIVGIAVILMGFIIGHHETFNTSTGVPWGILISTYVFLVVSSTGLCLVSSLGHVFGMERFEPLGKRAIFFAIVILLSGFLVIASDLERPWRMVMYLFVTPNPTSAMWWMGILYSLYLVAMAFELYFLCRVEIMRRLVNAPDTVTGFHRLFLIGISEQSPGNIQTNLKLARFIGATGVICALAAHSTLGAVFGFIGARAIWHGPFLPIYFILSAYVSGSAILILTLTLTHKGKGQESAPKIASVVQSLSKILLVFLGIFLFFIIWKIMTAQYGIIPEEYDAITVMINGPLAISFWVGEITIGILVPAAILIKTQGRKVWGLLTASLLVIIGMFFARYDFVIAGQLAPIIGQDEQWSYFPHIVEIMTVVAAIAMALFLYLLGSRFLPLEDIESGEEGEETKQPLIPAEAATDKSIAN